MSSNSTYIAVLTTYLPMIINFFTVILGTVGGIGNLITFTAPRLRSNSCVFYLLCASVFQILSILFLIPTRIALDNFGNTLEHQSIVFCKIRYYLSLTLPQLVTYYLLLAIVDRCFATSKHARIRSWNKFQIAHRCSLGVLILIAGGTMHVLIFFGIHQNTCQIPPDNGYAIFFAVYLIVVITLLPHLLMFIFSIITMNNLKQSRQRISPANSNGGQSRMKRLETQLILVRKSIRLISSNLSSPLDSVRTSLTQFYIGNITLRLVYLYNIHQWKFE